MKQLTLWEDEENIYELWLVDTGIIMIIQDSKVTKRRDAVIYKNILR